MIQVLLEERLKLRIHRETRSRPVYVVTVAKNGPLFSKAEMPSSGDPSVPAAAAQMRGANVSTGERGLSGIMSVQSLLTHIAGWLDRPMVDKTGLEGLYSINFHWKVELSAKLLAGDGGDSSMTTLPAAGGDNGYLFAEMEKRLGLRVEARKEEVDMLVVDHVERKPIEN